MKFNSKILGVLLALLAVLMVISAASAVNLANDFSNDGFGIKTSSGTDFNETAKIATNDMDFVIYENLGSDSSDVNSIIYFKDSTADKNIIKDFINDLENDGAKVEETNKYIVLKNNQNLNDVDIEGSIDSIFNFADSVFSSDSLNLSADGNSISLSGDGLEVHDASGENVSITSDGITVSGEASSDNETVNVSGDVDSNIENCDYSLYMKNQDNDKVIVLSGNDLELLKAMAETVAFNEN